ncbi:MAG: extracellular solute-binding protein [Luteitalea sp.]|nr:extracellular solute-binding protein [Luteitalea sp.]
MGWRACITTSATKRALSTARLLTNVSLTGRADHTSVFTVHEHKMSRPTRRQFLKSTATIAAGTALAMPHVRKAAAATLELRWLGWEHYNVAKIVREFEKAYKVRISSSYIDANSEAYNTLRAGGTADFDLVMGDGFWPRLYAKQGLTQPVDYRKIANIDKVFPHFRPPGSTILQEEGGKAMIAAPNCWGGYGLTVNLNKIDKADAHSLSLLFNDKYGRRLSTSARLEENIALAGILAAHKMGTKTAARPDGKPFNPYVLTDAELEEAKALLIKQKRLLVTRWNDENTLERLLRAEAVWASPEWSGIYRRIHFDKLDGKTRLNMTHALRPTEGGLGWVDSWAISAGVTSSEKLELCHKWIDWRLKPENMAIVATDLGWSPTVDVRRLIPRRYVETLFLNQTQVIQDLYQYDAPSSPEKWERVWSEVQAA